MGRGDGGTTRAEPQAGHSVSNPHCGHFATSASVCNRVPQAQVTGLVMMRLPKVKVPDQDYLPAESAVQVSTPGQTGPAVTARSYPPVELFSAPRKARKLRRKLPAKKVGSRGTSSS